MMTRMTLLTLGLALLPVTVALGQNLGDIPLPVVKGVSVQTAVQYDSSTQNYTYTYAVTNPATNTGSIWYIVLDLTAPPKAILSSGSQFTIPRGKLESFYNLQQLMNSVDQYPDGNQTVPFGITAPAGWDGSLTVNHAGGFASMSKASNIAPGQTLGGLSMISLGVPTIRNMQLIPHWVLEVSGESDPDQDVQAQQAQASLVITLPVLGPSWVTPGSLDQFDELQNDLTKAIQLGWIPDATLAQSIQNQLQAARDIVSKEGLDANAQTALQALLTTINSSTPSQRSQDAYTLLSDNVASIIAQIPPYVPPPPPPVIPQAKIIVPASHYVILPVGATVTITARVVNQAVNNAPLPNYNTTITVDSGPDAGTSVSGVTDQTGSVTFNYTGAAEGTDAVSLRVFGAASGAVTKSPAIPLIRVISPNDTATIILRGGADLIISKFVPPVLMWDGKSTIYISDATKNIGNIAITSSTTRYYISSTKPVDPTTAAVVGERSVPALQPGQEDFHTMQVALPSGLTAGTYYFLACANAGHAVVETNYANNCQINELVSGVIPTALPPDCSHAGPTIASLWPPNHKMVDISVTGVTDPNNLPVTIAITGIQQDEPVEEPGSGNTEPDGAGVGTSVAQVRAERSGTGSGRIYFIAFKASDSDGGSCNTAVQVYVPHDQGQGMVPVDTGQRYDSTQP